MQKFIQKPRFFYLTTFIIFILIIGIFSAIYPQTMDEFRFSHNSLKTIINQLSFTFSCDSSRIMNLLLICFLYLGNWTKVIFTILNPFVQLFIIFGVFFVATGRKINFKTRQDFYPLLLLILMFLLMIPQPSNVFFWIAGAFNYSWAFVPPLILLCLFRKTIDGEEIKSSFPKNILMLFIGFCAGMSNENTGPMMLGLCVLFLLYCNYKKIKIPAFYYYALAGISLGIGMMFGSGASQDRLKRELYISWQDMGIKTKLFLFIPNFNRFLAATFWLPVINLFGLLFILFDKKQKILKNKDFLLSSLFCSCGFVLAFVLFMAPKVSIRAFYSSAIFFFISFFMMLFILKNLYKINLFKFLAIILFILLLVLSPLITLPYITLYKSDNFRKQTITQALKQGKKEVYVNRITILNGPTENLSPLYYDILWPYLDKKLAREFKIKLKYEYNEDLFLKQIKNHNITLQTNNYD